VKKLRPSQFYNQKTVGNALNAQSLVTTYTASGAIPVTEDCRARLNGASLAMTVAAPTVEGVRLKIDNIAGSAATVDVTSADANAAANLFTLAAAAATARASLILEAINTGTVTAPTLVWSSFMGAGCTVA